MQSTIERSTVRRVIAGVALLAAAGTAIAHPGHEAQGPAAALAHPFTGVDHLLAMLAVGMLAARLGGGARWSLPAMFLAAMLAGAAAVGAGLAVPGAALESLIAASVLVAGLALVLRARGGLAAALPVVAGFAFFHGAAHGLELGLAQAPAFLLSTLCLHGIGLAAGALLARRALLPASGVPIAVSGALLLAQAALG